MILGVNILTLGTPQVIDAYADLAGHLAFSCRKQNILKYMV